MFECPCMLKGGLLSVLSGASAAPTHRLLRRFRRLGLWLLDRRRAVLSRLAAARRLWGRRCFVEGALGGALDA